MLTHNTGNLTESASYDSFGNASGNLSTRYQFTGREFDSFTKLHYYRARFYDANLGRFISEDPIGFAGGDINLYGYVGNTPHAFTDSSGLAKGPGSNFADQLDEKIRIAHQYWTSEQQAWITNGLSQTATDLSHGFSDMLRVGEGTACVFADNDDNI